MEAPFIEGPGAGAAPAVHPQAVSTVNALPGFRVVRPLGVVRGITVRSRNVAADLGAGLKSIVGGEIKTFTALCDSARQEAFQRMLEQAAERGANGVVAVRYDSNSIAQGITEVVAYGMAITDGGIPTSCDASADLGMAEGWICTANELPGYTLHQSLGVVQGLTVRTRNVVAGVGAGLKSLVGGEIKTYTKMCEDARQQAYARMIAEAVELGADGIVAMRYDTNEVAEGVTEVLAYGTAVSSTPHMAATVADPAEGLPRGMLTTASTLPGLPEQHSLGMVQGISVRSSSLPRAIGAGLKSIVGGEIRTWTALCTDSRAKALRMMVEQAHQRRARGVVAVRYDCNQVCDGVVEVIAYGTAVSDEPPAAGAPAASPAEVPRRSVTTDLALPHHLTQQTLGTVRGISVRSTNLVLSIGAGLKSIVGGEIRNYTRMCELAREEAYARMLQHAAELGATGITCMRFESNNPEKGVVEVVAYGTAVSDGSRPLPAATNTARGALGTAFTSTSNELHPLGHQRSLGVALGITVRSRNLLANIGAGLKAAFVGGEIGAWTSLCESTRQQALDRLLEEAAGRGAQGVVGLRYATAEVAPGVVEVLAYGTAVAA